MITENLSTLKIHKLTKAQYDRELAAGNIDPNALYLTPDEEVDLSIYATTEQLEAKADVNHNHGISEITDLQSKLDVLSEETKSYTDTAVSGLASTSSVNTSINTHNTSTSAHEDIRTLISDLSTAVNNFLDVDDTTKDQLSEVLTLIENNKGTLESLTTSKINVSDIVDNLTTNSTSKVLSAAQGVVIQGLIDALQTEINNKASAEHNHDDRYYTEIEIDEKLTNTKNNTWYGACSTSGTTRTVTTSTGDFSLTEGNIIYVLFTYAATASTTLNVDGTGAKNIKSVATTNVSANQWAANEVVALVYDGTYFRMLDGMTASTTYYGMTKLSSSTSSTATNLAATPSAVKSAYDLADAALSKSGGTMTGAITLNADPTDALHAVTKQYVDNLLGSILNGAS